MDRRCVNDKETFKEKFGRKFCRVCEWIVRHQTEVEIVCTVGTFACYKGYKAYKNYASNHPKQMFDPTLGVMMPLTRRMTNQDKIEYCRYINAGLTRHEALTYCGLIK